MILLIYGASGLAKEIYDLVLRSCHDKYEKIYFIDDFVEEKKFYFSETIHFDSISDLFRDRKDCVEGIVAVGEPAHRKMLAEKFEDAGIPLATLIDKTAVISPTAMIEQGCIVCEQALVHADARIEKGVLLQPHSIIGHDATVGRFSVISSGCVVCGDVKIGEKTYVGVNSAIKEKLNVGSNVIVAMGSVLFADIADNNTVVGNPARITKGNQSHRVFS